MPEEAHVDSLRYELLDWLGDNVAELYLELAEAAPLNLSKAVGRHMNRLERQLMPLMAVGEYPAVRHHVDLQRRFDALRSVERQLRGYDFRSEQWQGAKSALADSARGLLHALSVRGLPTWAVAIAAQLSGLDDWDRLHERVGSLASPLLEDLRPAVEAIPDARLGEALDRLAAAVGATLDAYDAWIYPETDETGAILPRGSAEGEAKKRRMLEAMRRLCEAASAVEAIARSHDRTHAGRDDRQ